MSDTERSNQADDETAVAKTDDAQPPAESGAGATAEPTNRPRLADRLMGRTSGPKAEAAAGGNEPSKGLGASKGSGAPKGSEAPKGPAKPSSGNSDIQPTGSAASAVPAPAGAKQSSPGTRPAQGDASTVLSAGPVMGTGRPDFAAGVPTTVTTASREDLQVGVLDPKDVSAKTENTGSNPQEEKAASNREILTKGRPSTRRTRKARLRLASVDPWSVMKMAFLFSMAAGIALVVAVMVIWFIIGQSGLFDAVNSAVNDALSAPGDQNSFDLSRFVSGGRVIGSAMVLAVIDVLLLTALATVGAFLYNLGATLLGGFEVTLADD